MARLLKTTIARVQANRIETARGCSQTSGAFSILKGFQTIVATPMGGIFINNTGNPGMATAGSGDILAGILARFVAAWSRRFRGADLTALADHISAAVFLHGLAGDLAAEEKGVESMIATDLLACLPEAFKKVVSG
jgi:NAD(P)H-hydrate epimerase